MINILTILFSNEYSFDQYVFFLLNLGIIAGYLAIVVTALFATKMLPALTVFTSKKTRLSAALFFLVSSITRLEFSYEAINPSYSTTPYATYVRICQIPLPHHDLAIHVVQLVSIWAMIIFLAHDLLTRFKVVREKE